MKKQSSKISNTYKPDWTPENAGDEFAVRVVKGKESLPTGKAGSRSSTSLIQAKLNEKIFLLMTM